MKTHWDYTQVAKNYTKRPGYCPEAIEQMLSVAHIGRGNLVCDIGAGTANLTLMLAQRGLNVVAIEPNDAMRKQGVLLTANYDNVRWVDAIGEDTGLSVHSFALVTYASSFNTTERQKALIEAHRILIPGGWFACMWNHRDINDTLQVSIGEILKRHIPDYDNDDYGKRHEDQSEIINGSGLFNQVKKLSGAFLYRVPKKDFIRMWRSHGTMHPQAKNQFSSVVSDIEHLVSTYNQSEWICISYLTKIWMAQVK